MNIANEEFKCEIKKDSNPNSKRNFSLSLPFYHKTPQMINSRIKNSSSQIYHELKEKLYKKHVLIKNRKSTPWKFIRSNSSEICQSISKINSLIFDVKSTKCISSNDTDNEKYSENNIITYLNLKKNINQTSRNIAQERLPFITTFRLFPKTEDNYQLEKENLSISISKRNPFISFNEYLKSKKIIKENVGNNQTQAVSRHCIDRKDIKDSQLKSLPHNVTTFNNDDKDDRNNNQQKHKSSCLTLFEHSIKFIPPKENEWRYAMKKRINKQYNEIQLKIKQIDVLKDNTKSNFVFINKSKIKAKLLQDCSIANKTKHRHNNNQYEIIHFLLNKQFYANTVKVFNLNTLSNHDAYFSSRLVFSEIHLLAAKYFDLYSEMAKYVDSSLILPDHNNLINNFLIETAVKRKLLNIPNSILSRFYNKETLFNLNNHIHVNSRIIWEWQVISKELNTNDAPNIIKARENIHLFQKTKPKSNKKKKRYGLNIPSIYLYYLNVFV